MRKNPAPRFDIDQIGYLECDSWNREQHGTSNKKQRSFLMPRTLIEPHKGDKRYVRRKGGKFSKSQDEVGRSLAVDRRKHAKTKVKRGDGDRGDR